MSLRVLVVEDDREIRTLIQSALTRRRLRGADAR